MHRLMQTANKTSLLLSRLEYVLLLVGTRNGQQIGIVGYTTKDTPIISSRSPGTQCYIYSRAQYKYIIALLIVVK